MLCHYLPGFDSGATRRPLRCADNHLQAWIYTGDTRWLHITPIGGTASQLKGMDKSFLVRRRRWLPRSRVPIRWMHRIRSDGQCFPGLNAPTVVRRLPKHRTSGKARMPARTASSSSQMHISLFSRECGQILVQLTCLRKCRTPPSFYYCTRLFSQCRRYACSSPGSNWGAHEMAGPDRQPVGLELTISAEMVDSVR